MDEARHHFLAGAAFSQNHDCCVGRSGTTRSFKLLLHGGTVALNGVGLAQILQALPERGHLLLQFVLRQPPFHGQQKILPLERLLQIVECAVSHRDYRAFNGAESRQENHANVRVSFMQPRENLLARHLWHLYIEQQQVGRLTQRLLKAQFRVSERFDHDVAALQHPLDVFAHGRLVIQDKNTLHTGASWTNQWYGCSLVNREGGNSSVKQAPPPPLGSYFSEPS